VFVVSGIACFYRLGQRDLWSSHEARAAQDAVSVLEGDWLIPRLYDGRLELQKPPLYYWWIAAWCHFTNHATDALAVRLPAALSALLLIATLLVLGYVVARPIMGILAATALLLMPHFLGLTHVGRIDMPMTLCMSIALATGFVYVRQRCESRRSYFFIMLIASMLTFGVLLKGPIAIVLFGLTLAAYFVCEWLTQVKPRLPGKEFRRFCGRLLAPEHVVLALLLLTPAFAWYIAANECTNGEWVREFLYRHNFARGLGGDAQLDRHAHWLGPAFYVVRLPLLVGPVLFVIPWLGCTLWRYLREDEMVRFSLIWCLVPIVFLSLMRYKRSDYLLPAYPGLALLIGSVFSRYCENLAPAQQRRYYIVYGAGFIITLGVWLSYLQWGLPILDSTRQQCSFAQSVRTYTPHDAVIMYGTEAHLVTYHVGKPVLRTFELGQLRRWLTERGGKTFVVTTRRCYQQLAETTGDSWQWEIILANTNAEVSPVFTWLHLEKDEPLILACASPKQIADNVAARE
jgi:4-amino-4-deoxy-L-arabinose transferase-like glycosyltransferase